MTKYAFWTDAPPLIEGATGCHGVAENIIKSQGPDIALVITHKFRRRINPSEIAAACGDTPLFLYPDCATFGIRRFSKVIADWLELVLFSLTLPRLLRALRLSGATRIFALMGADGWTLWHILLLRFSGLPIDIYLVDDLVESARLNKRSILLKTLGWLQPFCLNRCDRVFTISPGFTEKLKKQFGIDSKVLYLLLPETPGRHRPFVPSTENPRSIAFIGALNHLYVSSILDIYDEILSWNLLNTKNPFRLKITTYSDPSIFLSKIKDRSAIDIRQNIPKAELDEFLKTSFICLLPYSFSPEERHMVETSFSCKILEYLVSGRPMLVYGPDTASLTRHFRDNGIPFHASHREELRKILGALATEPSVDDDALISSYKKLWEDFHSPAAFARTISINE